jgi:hypothetical protein
VKTPWRFKSQISIKLRGKRPFVEIANFKHINKAMQPRYAENNTLNRATSPERPKAAKASASQPESKSQDKQPREPKQKPVEFVLNAPQASSVVIAGTFNQWDPQKTPLQRDGDGWKARIPLKPGRYEYRFVVDGQWITDPNCKETVRNDYGSTNSVLVV